MLILEGSSTSTSEFIHATVRRMGRWRTFWKFLWNHGVWNPHQLSHQWRLDGRTMYPHCSILPGWLLCEANSRRRLQNNQLIEQTQHVSPCSFHPAKLKLKTSILRMSNCQVKSAVDTKVLMFRFYWYIPSYCIGTNTLQRSIITANRQSSVHTAVIDMQSAEGTHLWLAQIWRESNTRSTYWSIRIRTSIAWTRQGRNQSCTVIDTGLSSSSNCIVVSIQNKCREKCLRPSKINDKIIDASRFWMCWLKVTFRLGKLYYSSLLVLTSLEPSIKI